MLLAFGLYLCWRIGSARAAPLHPPTGVEGRTRRKCISSKGSDCVSWSAAPYECQKAAAVVNYPAATAEARADAAVDLQTAAARMGADDTILSTSFFLNQFYNKLLRHAFLPELTCFDNTATLRSFCECW